MVEDAKQKAIVEKIEQDEKDLRNWRQSYWTADSSVKYDEAAVAKVKRAAELKQSYDASITATYDEWADRDYARTRMQVGACRQCTPLVSQSFIR